MKTINRPTTVALGKRNGDGFLKTDTKELDKVSISSRPIKQYTMGEEVFNSVTHGVGALLSVIGGSVLVTLAAVYGDTRAVVACTIYGISLVLLYTMSTLYHAFPFPTVKKIFRIFDHSTVFILIAGTYTPFTLMALGGNPKGLVIFFINWAVAIIGIVLNSFSVNKFAKLSLVLYLVMGWSVIFVLKDIVASLPFAGMMLLILGGLSYTGGVAFYLAKKKKYTHSVWHLFVLLGSILHYFCILLYVLF